MPRNYPLLSSIPTGTGPTAGMNPVRRQIRFPTVSPRFQSLKLHRFLSALVLFAGSIYADDKRSDPPSRPTDSPSVATAGDGSTPTFSNMDSDRNGQVTKAEFMQFHSRQIEVLFAKLDKDADGILVQKELAATVRRPGPSRLQKAPVRETPPKTGDSRPINPPPQAERR